MADGRELPYLCRYCPDQRILKEPTERVESVRETICTMLKWKYKRERRRRREREREIENRCSNVLMFAMEEGTVPESELVESHL